MVKVFFFVCLALGLLRVSRSITFQCGYSSGGGTSGIMKYFCKVQNFLNITTSTDAYVDSITGVHMNGYNNDNVKVFYVDKKGIINYFPRGLNTIFKNIEEISIQFSELKEIHQTDLKVFPKLNSLRLYSNQIEILEEGLFDFNPDLEYIDLGYNKISHIDSEAFDKLGNIWSLWLNSNACIDLYAYKYPTALQNIFKTVYVQCVNPEYLNLEQKLKNLKVDSKELSLQIFAENFEKLQSEINNSKFSGFFEQKLQDLKVILGNTVTTKSQTCLNLEPKLLNFTTNLKVIAANLSNFTNSCSQSGNNVIISQIGGICSALNSNSSNLSTTVDKFNKDVNEKSSKIINYVAKNTEYYENLNEIIDTNLEVLEKDLTDLKTFSYDKIKIIETEMKSAQFSAINANKAIDRVEKNLMTKIDKIVKALNLKI